MRRPSRTRSAPLAAVAAVCAGLTVVLIADGPSPSPWLSQLEFAATLLVGLGILASVVALATARLGAWREPSGEDEFEAVVQRAEELAREGLYAEPGEEEFLERDPLRDEDFAELVRDALDELPDLLQNALAHVAVVISDGGRRHRAYGLYQSRPERIVVFRDTLRRDFGHDPERLRDQVVRTVRHELAHHVGFDEMGVRGLGL